MATRSHSTAVGLTIKLLIYFFPFFPRKISLTEVFLGFEKISRNITFYKIFERITLYSMYYIKFLEIFKINSVRLYILWIEFLTLWITNVKTMLIIYYYKIFTGVPLSLHSYYIYSIQKHKSNF